MDLKSMLELALAVTALIGAGVAVGVGKAQIAGATKMLESVIAQMKEFDSKLDVMSERVISVEQIHGEVGRINVRLDSHSDELHELFNKAGMVRRRRATTNKE